MRAKLSCAIVTVLIIGADVAAIRNAAEIATIPVDSHWELVRGQIGEVRIEGASLTIDWRDVHLGLKVPEEQAERAIRLSSVYGQMSREKQKAALGIHWVHYQLNAQTGMISFSEQWLKTGKRYEGRCRMVGDHLELTMTQFERLPLFRSWYPLADEIHLIFKRTK